MRQAVLTDLPRPDEFIGKLEMEWLNCRELGHAWRSKSLGRGSSYGFERRLVCANCETERIDLIDTWGIVQHRRYVYPAGYQFKGSSAWGIGREDFRREVLRRLGYEVSRRRWEAAEEPAVEIEDAQVA